MHDERQDDLLVLRLLVVTAQQVRDGPDEAGVVRQRPEGTSRLNTLRRDDLDARFPGLLDAILEARADRAG